MEIKTVYEVSYEMWEYNVEDEDYTSGPYDSQLIRVEEYEEAKKLVEDWKKEHPSAQSYRIDYDKEDRDMGIVEQKLICAYSDSNDVNQYCIDLFKIKYKNDEVP